MTHPQTGSYEPENIDLCKDLKQKTCIICKQKFKGYGNNPRPLENSGVCCDFCNVFEVIPARMRWVMNDAR